MSNDKIQQFSVVLAWFSIYTYAVVQFKQELDKL